MAVFPFRLHHGHIIIEPEDRRLLVDTGAPTSFGRPDAFAHVGMAHPPPAYFGVGIDQVSTFVGDALDGLLGMDVIRIARGLTVNWQEQTVTLGPVSVKGGTADAPWLLGCPLVSMTVGGRTVNAVVDTGAFVSYATGPLLAGGAPAGIVDDFHPFLGRFSAQLRRQPVTLGGLNREHAFGLPPPLVNQLLQSFGVSAVIGTDLLQYVSAVGIDPEAQRVVLVDC